MKIGIVLIISFLTLSQAQLNAGVLGSVGGPLLGFPSSQFFKDVVLQSEAQKLLAQPLLPEDLKQSILDVIKNAEAGFNGCNEISTLPLFQKGCIILQLQSAKSELKLIEDEANVRVAALIQTESSNLI